MFFDYYVLAKSTTALIMIAAKDWHLSCWVLWGKKIYRTHLKIRLQSLEAGNTWERGPKQTFFIHDWPILYFTLGTTIKDMVINNFFNHLVIGIMYADWFGLPQQTTYSQVQIENWTQMKVATN